MTIYLVLKFLHIIGGMVILGTGSGIAFFLLMAHLSGDAAFISRTLRIVVLADFLFTTTAVAAQPITGYLLMRETATPMSASWIIASFALFAVAAVFWIPVVWMQIKMRQLAATAASESAVLPDLYYKLFRVWFAFGFPGFGADWPRIRAIALS